MRLTSIRIVTATLSLILTSLPAAAQQPGWVDPPDKPAAPQAGEPRAVGLTVPAPPAQAETSAADEARRLALAYLATVSADDMAEAAPRFYGSWVRFHDRLLSRQALVAEKRRFVRRWPERRYVVQGDPQVVCSDAARTCIVRALLRFEAASAARTRRSRGLAEVALTIKLDEGRPVIVAETSRVLRRGLASRGGARFIPAG